MKKNFIKKMTSSKPNQVKSLIAVGFFFSRRQRPVSWHRQTFTEERLVDAQKNKTARTSLNMSYKLTQM